jgi:hypothetical protein
MEAQQSAFSGAPASAVEATAHTVPPAPSAMDG